MISQLRIRSMSSGIVVELRCPSSSDELVIELSEDFAVFNIRYPMTHESCPALSNCERYFTKPLLEFPEKPLL